MHFHITIQFIGARATSADYRTSSCIHLLTLLLLFICYFPSALLLLRVKMKRKEAEALAANPISSPMIPRRHWNLRRLCTASIDCANMLQLVRAIFFDYTSPHYINNWRTLERKVRKELLYWTCKLCTPAAGWGQSLMRILRSLRSSHFSTSHESSDKVFWKHTQKFLFTLQKSRTCAWTQCFKHATRRPWTEAL